MSLRLGTAPYHLFVPHITIWMRSRIGSVLRNHLNSNYLPVQRAPELVRNAFNPAVLSPLRSISRSSLPIYASSVSCTGCRGAHAATTRESSEFVQETALASNSQRNLLHSSWFASLLSEGRAS
eukprot:3939098-Rhodomonas_salina.1